MNLEGSAYGKYKIVSLLGTGTYGTVYHVKSPDSKDFVIKAINLKNLSQKKQQRSLKEVSVLETQSHPHLISYLSSCIYQKKLLILMEFASGGDLQSLKNYAIEPPRHTSREIHNLNCVCMFVFSKSLTQISLVK